MFNPIDRLAREKFDYLNTLPWLLTRLNQPGVRDEALRQFESSPPETHHRVTLQFLGAESILRRDVLSMNADGTGLTKELFDAVHGFAFMPMDDAAGERPHAAARREWERARGASWPFVAASMRMSDNLHDACSLPKPLGVDLQHEWSTHKRVLQQKYNDRRPVKLKYKDFCRLVYHPRFSVAVVDDWEAVVPHDDLGPRDYGPHHRDGVIRDDVKRALRDFNMRSLQPYSYYSVADPSIEPNGLRVFPALGHRS